MVEWIIVSKSNVSYYFKLKVIVKLNHKLIYFLYNNSFKSLSKLLNGNIGIT